MRSHEQFKKLLTNYVFGSCDGDVTNGGGGGAAMLWDVLCFV